MLHKYEYSIFQNQGTPCCLCAASSCLALLVLISSCYVWVCGHFQHIIILQLIWISNLYFADYSSRTLWKPITTNVTNNCKHVWEWFIFGPTRQSKTRQDKAGRRFVATIQYKKGVHWFWKILCTKSRNHGDAMTPAIKTVKITVTSG